MRVAPSADSVRRARSYLDKSVHGWFVYAKAFIVRLRSR